MTRFVLAATLLVCSTAAQAQQEGPATTQTLVTIQSSSFANPTAADITLKVNNHPAQLIDLTRIPAKGLQIAILIDDGLRESVARQLPDLRNFILHLTPGTEVYVGYMQNGHVATVQPFTTAYESAAQSLRLPMGAAGLSGSPYFCLSDFVKHWPEAPAAAQTGLPEARKARFVLMITSGVDPYNGSVSMTNQNSPYVDSAIVDAQRAGVAVYSIYATGQGQRGGAASFSGQSYLGALADGTGGRSYYNGLGNPVSITPYLSEFQRDIAATWIATFQVPASKDLTRIKLSTRLHGTKIRAPELVRPGELQSSLQ